MNLIATGNGVTDFVIDGNVIIMESIDDIKGKCKGRIVVVKNPTPDIVVLFLENILGVISEYGGLTCHLALICRECGIRCVVGANNITNVVKNGMNIHIASLDGKGEIYEHGAI